MVVTVVVVVAMLECVELLPATSAMVQTGQGDIEGEGCWHMPVAPFSL